MISVKEISEFKNYGRVLSIDNGIIEAFVTLDFGPRIIKFAYKGEKSVLCSNRDAFPPKSDKILTDFYGENKAWENAGGHRIWISPESYPETYYPDNDEVSYKTTETGAVFSPNPEKENGVQKELELIMSPDSADMQVVMRVTNIGDTDKEFSVWAITVCDKGGKLIIPMNQNDTGLLSNRIISVWPYTDMSDDRIYWGKKYVTVRQDKISPSAVKLGFDLNGGKVYYVNEDNVFIKSFAPNHPFGTYPDNGCSFETYTNKNMIEVETLGELKTVCKGETAVHTENWSLHKSSHPFDLKNDGSIDEFLKTF